jgi:predicted phosphodiesterase
MRALAHLSDLHFGRIDPAALEPLRLRLAALAPDLVVVSGDLTQRARRSEFRAARAFLDRLPQPQLVVPGNHDLPLFNLVARALHPLRGFRREIAADEEPCFADDEILVLGINTARSLTWKAGRVDARQLAQLRDKLCRAAPRATRILVSHHPFMQPAALADCGVDILVAGHMHAASAGPALERGDMHGLGAVVVQAGTATSRRTRDEPNSFNLLRVGWRRLQVEQYTLRDTAFVRSATERFRHDGGAWRRDESA